MLPNPVCFWLRFPNPPLPFRQSTSGGYRDASGRYNRCGISRSLVWDRASKGASIPLERFRNASISLTRAGDIGVPRASGSPDSPCGVSRPSAVALQGFAELRVAVRSDPAETVVSRSIALCVSSWDRLVQAVVRGVLHALDETSAGAIVTSPASGDRTGGARTGGAHPRPDMHRPAVPTGRSQQPHRCSCVLSAMTSFEALGYSGRKPASVSLMTRVTR